ncbi:MAK10-like protein [Tanacetum coccineum]
MAEMFRILKELTTSRVPKKVLIKEEAKSPVTKNVNSISLTRGEEEKSDKDDVATGDDIKNLTGQIWRYQFNDSLSGVRVGKMKGKIYNLSPRGPVYKAILKKKITRKEDIRGNFEIPCNIGGLKRMNALVDQGSDMNVIPLSTYMTLTDERPAETDIRLSLASHSYIYPLGIVEDVLVDVAGYVYPVDFMILDMKEDEKRPFILRTPFLTTAKAVIKFDKGTITLRSGKSKINFHRIPESLYKVEKRIKIPLE